MHVVVTRLDVEVVAVTLQLRWVVIEVSRVVILRLPPTEAGRGTIGRAVTVPRVGRLIEVPTMSTTTDVGSDLRADDSTDQSAKISAAMSTVMSVTTTMSVAATMAVATVTMLGLDLVAKRESECGSKCDYGNDHFRA